LRGGSFGKALLGWPWLPNPAARAALDRLPLRGCSGGAYLGSYSASLDLGGERLVDGRYIPAKICSLFSLCDPLQPIHSSPSRRVLSWSGLRGAVPNDPLVVPARCSRKLGSECRCLAGDILTFVALCFWPQTRLESSSSGCKDRLPGRPFPLYVTSARSSGSRLRLLETKTGWSRAVDAKRSETFTFGLPTGLSNVRTFRSSAAICRTRMRRWRSSAEALRRRTWRSAFRSICRRA